jgi:hypothetical protein
MNQIIPQQTIFMNELITFDYGCLIVSMHCSSQERYAFLPQQITRRGIVCQKVSYHDHTKRAYYRSAKQTNN